MYVSQELNAINRVNKLLSKLQNFKSTAVKLSFVPKQFVMKSSRFEINFETSLELNWNAKSRKWKAKFAVEFIGALLKLKTRFNINLREEVTARRRRLKYANWCFVSVTQFDLGNYERHEAVLVSFHVITAIRMSNHQSNHSVMKMFRRGGMCVWARIWYHFPAVHRHPAMKKECQRVSLFMTRWKIMLISSWYLSFPA